jgi:hypothetical protein
VHEPDAPELIPGPELQARFDWGHRVGEAARHAYPGGVLVPFERGRLREAVAATAIALENGADRLYEAAFQHDSVFVAVDVLEQGPRGWVIHEVKSTTRVKDEHLPDAAIQAWVLEGAGHLVHRVEVVTLDRECVYPDLDRLFKATDVTREVASLKPDIAGTVGSLLAVLGGPLPSAETGERCKVPHRCPFFDRCWPEVADDHVSRLYFGGRRMRELLTAGIERIGDIPGDVKLSGVQARQVRACREGCAAVDGDGLADALDAFEAPVRYLDFETVSPPIPMWNGCRPYDAVPVQFACLEENDGSATWYEHLALPGCDPRPALARALVRACGESGSVLAYNVAFERRCVEHLIAAVPEEAPALEGIWERLDDLLPVVRDRVYAPAFRGSFGLKSVLPALLPDLAYDDLEVKGGETASLELERLLLGTGRIEAGEVEPLRTALLAYCRRDVEGLAALHGWLLAHAM